MPDLPDWLLRQRAEQDREREVINSHLDALGRQTSLVRLVGVDLALKVAAHGLRTVWDLDQAVMAYREKEIRQRWGLKPREATAVFRSLLEWSMREWRKELDRIRGVSEGDRAA